MKQWLCDGWFRFKAWVFFNYWRRLTNEDSNELLRLYYIKRWEKRAMKRYVEYLDTHPFGKESADMTGSDWYIGTINPEKMMDASLEKKDD